MDLSLWMTFVGATLLLLIIPGPTVVLVLTYPLTQGRRVAVASAAGVALGDFIAMTASLVGLGALFWRHRPCLWRLNGSVRPILCGWASA